MGLINKVQVSVNIGKVTADQIELLAKFNGVDPGEMRRILLLQGTHSKMAEMQAALGDRAAEYMVPSESAIALIKALVTGKDLDAAAIESVAESLGIAPHELQAKLKKENGRVKSPVS